MFKKSNLIQKIGSLMGIGLVVATIFVFDWKLALILFLWQWSHNLERHY